MNADRLNRYAILYELKKTLELEVKKLNAQMAEAEAGILEDFESGEDGIADVHVAPNATFLFSITPLTRSDVPLPAYVYEVATTLPSEQPIAVRRTLIKPDSKLWVSASDGDMTRACDALLDAGLDGYVRREFHSGQLSGYVREELAAGRDLPPALNEALTITEKFTLAVRRS